MRALLALYLAGDPLLDDLLLGGAVFLLHGLDDLDGRALDLLAVGDVGLGDLDLGLGVLDQDVVVLDDGVSDLDLAALVDGERGVGRDGVALGGDGLAQGVLDAGLQALDHVRAAVGVPLELLAVELDDFPLGVDNLDVGSLELLLARDVGLGDADLGLRVLDEEHAALGDGAGRGDFAGLVDGEGGVGRDGVAVGGDGLAQGVLDAGLQALDQVRALLALYLAGDPLLDDLLLGGAVFLLDRLDDLDGRAVDLLAVGDVGLGDGYPRGSVRNIEHVALGKLWRTKDQVIDPRPDVIFLKLDFYVTTLVNDNDILSIVQQVTCRCCFLLKFPRARRGKGYERFAIRISSVFATFRTRLRLSRRSYFIYRSGKVHVLVIGLMNRQFDGQYTLALFEAVGDGVAI